MNLRPLTIAASTTLDSHTATAFPSRLMERREPSGSTTAPPSTLPVGGRGGGCRNYWIITGGSMSVTKVDY